MQKTGYSLSQCLGVKEPRFVTAGVVVVALVISLIARGYEDTLIAALVLGVLTLQLMLALESLITAEAMLRGSKRAQNYRKLVALLLSVFVLHWVSPIPLDYVTRLSVVMAVVTFGAIRLFGP